jgi:hypothetical protein
MKRRCGFLVAWVLVSLLVSNAIGQPRPEFVKPLEKWAGVVTNEKQKAAWPADGLIADEQAWAKLWTAWRPDDDVPEVEFSTSVVFVGLVPGPNRTIFAASLDAQGDLKITLGGTKVGGPGFGYVFAVLPREGIKTYRGQPLPKAAAASEYVRVEVRGKVATGVVAIGGETTGATITAEGITFELDFGDQRALAESAQRADGQVAKVRGRLERRAGVEVKERWILHVRALEPTGGGPR